MNTLDEIMPQILARGLMALREVAIMPRVVNGDYSSEAAQKGKTIDVPVPSAVGIQEVAPSNTPPSPGNTTVPTVPIPLDHWFQNDPLHLTDKEMVEIDRNRHFLPMQFSEAIRALANHVNFTIHQQYRHADRGVFGFTGTAGTTPFGTGVGVKSATQSRKKLNQQVCPKPNRRGVLDFDAEAAALELDAFNDASQTMSAVVKMEGEIGRKFGIDWVADDAVITHEAGTISDGANREALVNNGAGYAAGVDIINVDNTTLTGTILNGDILSFAGHAQTYCVVDNTSSAEFSSATDQKAGTVGTYTAAANAITGLKIFPALQEAVVDNEVITVEDTHVVNLVMHRDAIGFATRPLVASTADMALGSKILSLQDPQTGLVLRLEVSRQHKQVVWEFDILWGTKLVRPELACRLAG